MTDRVQPKETPAGAVDDESKTAPHPTSIAVWGLPSPVVVHRPFVAQVGVKCPAGCPLAGRTIVIRDAAGTAVGHATLGDAPEPGTNALYAARLTLEAPAEEGVHAWTAAFDGDPATPAPPASEPTPQPEPLHAGTAAPFGFRAVAPPEHRVTVTVCDRDGEAPLADAEVRLGVYRGTTDAGGRARVDVPGGSYDLYVRKTGYSPNTARVTVAGDLSLGVAAARASDPDPDDEQVWM